MVLVTSLMCGLLTTHSLVPPTPGPIAVAGILGADVGKVMIYGLIVAIPIILVTQLWCNSKFIKTRYPEIAEANDEDILANEKFAEIVAHSPSTFMSYLPIVVPIILIVVRSFVTQYDADTESIVYQIVNFIGTPYIALLIGTLLSFLLPTKLNGEVTDTWVSTAIQKSAEILLITGIAGCYGKILQAIGVGDVLAGIISSMGIPSVILPFIISAIVLMAQGSATVAMTTTAGIILPLLPALSISPELATVAIAGGSMCGVLPMGSYFWCVTKLSGYDIKKGYIAVTATTYVMGLTALIAVWVLSFVIH